MTAQACPWSTSRICVNFGGLLAGLIVGLCLAFMLCSLLPLWDDQHREIRRARSGTRMDADNLTGTDPDA